MQNPSTPDKQTLRLILKDKRASLTEDQHRTKSLSITANTEPLLTSYQTILLYAAKPAEVNTFPLIQTLLDAGKTVILPIIESETRTLRLSKIDSLNDLTPSTFGVPEPITREQPFPADQLDVIILPMVGFDRHGNRLGYGAGYYDRFLANNPTLCKIGLAYACQEADIIPTDEYDISLDIIVTETEILKIKKA